MKKCIRCNLEKPLEDFSKYKKSKDGLYSYCKICKRAYDNAYYKNVAGRKSQITDNRKAAKLVTQQFIYDYLKNTKCIDCGISNPIVLQFDHRNPLEKSYNVSNMNGLSIQTVQNEIEKCDVRCANCHCIRTAVQFSWYKQLIR